MAVVKRKKKKGDAAALYFVALIAGPVSLITKLLAQPPTARSIELPKFSI